MAFQRQWSAAASLTFSCPSIQRQAFERAAGHSQPGLDQPLSTLQTGPATEGEARYEAPLPSLDPYYALMLPGRPLTRGPPRAKASGQSDL